MLVRREVVLLKIESTYKTEATPAVTDAIFADKVQWSNEVKMLDRGGPKETLGKRQQVFGGRLAQISFSVELKGSGTLGVAPEYGQALLACGMKETISAGVYVLYSPDTTLIPSATIYYYQDGKLKKLLGARGQVSFEMAAQEFGKINFTFIGHPTIETDSAMITPTYDDIVPPQFISAAFTLNSVSLEISKFMVDLGNEISKPPSVNSASGIGEVRINGRDVKGTIDPESVLNTTKNFYNDLHVGAVGSLTTGSVGSTTGNKWTMICPKAAVRGIKEGDRDGIRTLEIDLGFGETTGDDEIGLELR